MSVTHYNGKKLYKVLVNGKSCHGGDFTWSLPIHNQDGTWTPGEWTPEVHVNLCFSGYHATWEPIQWANQDGIEVYEIEFYDAVQGSEVASKVVGKRCRLLSRIVDADVLLAMHIVVSGSHEAKDGIWYASGSAKVKVCGSAKVTASGSAIVKDYDSAKVTSSGSAIVEAFDSTTVNAYDTVTVISYKSHNYLAIVTLYDNAVHIDHRCGCKPVCRIACV